MSRHQLTPFFTPISATRGRVYISGPMTGIADYNAEQFANEARFLRTEGYSVCSPVETSLLLGQDLRHEQYLRFDFARVIECDYVVALDGWENSPGARAEIYMALMMGVIVWREGDGSVDVRLRDAQAAIAWGPMHGEPTP